MVSRPSSVFSKSYVIYPFLRKKGINFSPIRRILFGYSICVISMVVCAILQYRVYETSSVFFSFSFRSTHHPS
jgi:POT family proton-dependent oligopeptide transporter